MSNTSQSRWIDTSNEDGSRVENAADTLQNERQPASNLRADISAEDLRKGALELLAGIESALPDSQFLPATRTALHQLLQLAGDLQRDELVSYLQHAERFSAAANTRSRNGFRSAIRLCLELVDQDPNEIAGMAELRVGYLDHQRAALDGLKVALQNGDFAVLCKGGHNLKGTGAGYGFSELTDIGRALEAAAKERNTSTIEVLLDQIESYLNIVLPRPEDH